MCSSSSSSSRSKAKVRSTGGVDAAAAAVARINGRLPVLQPATISSSCTPTVTPNSLEILNNNNNNNNNSLKKKLSSKSPPPPTKSKCPSPTTPRPILIHYSTLKNNNNTTTTTNNHAAVAVRSNSSTPVLDRYKSKSFKESSSSSSGYMDQHVLSGSGRHRLLPSTTEASLSYSSALITESPGSIAAVRREHMALQQAQRKMKIAHYGRSKSARFLHPPHNNYYYYYEPKITLNPLDLLTTLDRPYDNNMNIIITHDHNDGHEAENLVARRCSFITSNSDPIYVAYHDQEWGVPAHDDRLLFELLVLSGAQVGSDWASTLRKRQDFRDAFSGFDPETVANISEKQMQSISTRYGIDVSRIRGVVDNSNRILEIEEEFGSFDKYIWGFVNKKPIQNNYKFGHKVPVKTSKSESISKDMVRRGFRFVGPTVVHSFMQAAGLTNDHLITCHRHLQCTLLAAPSLSIHN